MDELKRAKQHLRSEMRQKRDSLPLGVRHKGSLKMTEVLCASRPYREAEWVLTYVSMGSEVDTRLLIERVWQDGKWLLVPRAGQENKRLHPFVVRSWREMSPGLWGIDEPNEMAEPLMPENEQGLMHKTGLVLVPGLAFDARGFRLGYGGGYYDRYLEGFDGHALTVGLAFACQIVESVPVEAHDRPLDAVLTDEGWLKEPA